MQSRTAKIVLGCLTSLAVAWSATPAGAHVEPDPSSVAAGDAVTVSLLVGHGCDGADTTKLEVQLPEGVEDAEPQAPDGWEAEVADGVVTFTGGPLDAHTELGFPIAFTAPSDAEELRFPTVQYCGDTELAWIGEDPEGDNPAPVVEVTGAGAGATATTGGGSTETTVAVDTTTTTAAAGDAAADDEADDDDDGSSPVVPIVIVVVVLAAAGAGFAVVRARSAKNPN